VNAELMRGHAMTTGPRYQHFSIIFSLYWSKFNDWSGLNECVV